MIWSDVNADDFLALALPARAQQLSNPYGDAVTLDVARKAAAAALAEARKNGWNVAAAVVDPHGELVFFERMENTQWGSNVVSQEKARSAARFKRPTKAFEDAVKGQAPNVLGLPGALPVLSREALEAMRKREETPQGVRVFRAAGVNPMLTIWNVAGHVAAPAEAT